MDLSVDSNTRYSPSNGRATTERGWHWQLVASIAQQQEAIHRTTDKANRIQTKCKLAQPC